MNFLYLAAWLAVVMEDISRTVKGINVSLLMERDGRMALFFFELVGKACCCTYLHHG